jgi:hypothetical protein
MNTDIKDLVNPPGENPVSARKSDFFDERKAAGFNAAASAIATSAAHTPIALEFPYQASHHDQS